MSCVIRCLSLKKGFLKSFMLQSYHYFFYLASIENNFGINCKELRKLFKVNILKVFQKRFRLRFIFSLGNFFKGGGGTLQQNSYKPSLDL